MIDHEKLYRQLTGRPPAVGALLPHEGEIYRKKPPGVWEWLCSQEESPEDETAMVFELLEGIAITAPLKRIIEVVLQAHYNLSKGRCEDFVAFLFRLLSEGGWQSPQREPKQEVPGELLANTREGVAVVDVADCAPVVEQIAQRAPTIVIPSEEGLHVIRVDAYDSLHLRYVSEETPSEPDADQTGANLQPEAVS